MDQNTKYCTNCGSMLDESNSHKCPVCGTRMCNRCAAENDYRCPSCGSEVENEQLR